MITTIINNTSLSTRRWKILIANLDNNNAFLYPFARLFEYLYQTLKKDIAATHHLSSVINESFLQHWLQTDFSAKLCPVIERCCVLELHSASQRHYLQNKMPKARYLEFIEQLAKQENLFGFLEKYPELIKLLEPIFNHYLEAAQLLIQRLDRDWDKLQSLLPTQQPLKLTKIVASGDTHCQGKRVMILMFQDQQQHTHKLVYKPRNLAIDQAFQTFIDWFNQHCFELQLYQQKLINCDTDDYGWSEFVAYLPCDDRTALNRFYQRSGALLAIFYLLGGSDIHMENLIAHGEQPAIIDLECLLKPLCQSSETTDQIYKPSILESLFLPYKRMVREDYAGIDVSAIVATGGADLPYKITQWKNTGTDRLQMNRATIKLPIAKNNAFINGKQHAAIEFETDILVGFEIAYRLFMQHKQDFLGENSPLNPFKTAKTRVLFRSTADYARLLHESYDPTLIYYPEQRQQHLAWLNKIIPYHQLYQPLINTELQQLQQGDIPYFSSIVTQKAIYDSQGNNVAIPVIKSGWECVRTHLSQNINERDLYIQKRIIRNSYSAMRMSNEKNTHHFAQQAIANKTIATTEISTQLYQPSLKIINYLLKYLEKISITTQHNIYWPNVQKEKGITWNPAFTEFNLYGGTAGITLLFAYAAAVFKKPNYKQLALKGYTSLKYAFEQQKSIPTSSLAGSYNSIGLYDGIGGILYVLHQLYQLWGQPEIKKTLNEILIYAEPLIKQDKQLDLISGAAGLLLAINAVRNSIAPATYTRIIKKCTEHLLTSYPHPAKLCAAHQQAIIKYDQPQLGLAHGVSGIMLSLATVYPHLAEQKIAQWIKDGLAYEHLGFSEKHKNWKKILSTEHKKINSTTQTHTFNLAWCYGAPGIGLSRIALNKLMPELSLEQEIGTSIQTCSQSFKKITNPGLCHGLLGNIELLLQARLHYPHLCDEQTFLQYYQHTLNFLAAQLPHSIDSGITDLMTGITGITYQLMRLITPKKIPSILLIQ